MSSLPTINSGTPGSPNYYDLSGLVITSGWTADGVHDVVLYSESGDNAAMFDNAPVLLTNATNVKFKNTKHCNVADYAIDITGGNRTTLASGGNLLEGIEVFDCGGTYAVKLDGVGNGAQGIYVHDVDGRGVQLGGPVGSNDQFIKHSRFIRCAKAISDCGAVYLGGLDPSQAGNQLLYNFFDEIYGVDALNWAIYLDNHASLVTVKGNKVKNSRNGVFLNGGRDCLIDSNVFEALSAVGVVIKDRNTDVWPYVANTLQDMTSAPYAKYAHLTALAATHAVISTHDCYTGDDATWPKGNVVSNNQNIRTTPYSLSVGTTVTLTSSSTRAKDKVQYIGNQY